MLPPPFYLAQHTIATKRDICLLIPPVTAVVYVNIHFRMLTLGRYPPLCQFAALTVALIPYNTPEDR